jgi:hypothetical protein
MTRSFTNVHALLTPHSIQNMSFLLNHGLPTWWKAIIKIEWGELCQYMGVWIQSNFKWKRRNSSLACCTQWLHEQKSNCVHIVYWPKLKAYLNCTFFWWYWGLKSGPHICVLARQVLYHLSQATSFPHLLGLFCGGSVFQIRPHAFACTSLGPRASAFQVAGTTCMNHQAWLDCIFL